MPGTTEATSPVFLSPDGQSVGYWEDGQLKRLAVGGGAPVVICATVRPLGATWTRDGNILFAGDDGIMRVPESGGTPERIVAAADGERFDAPQLLPDGQLMRTRGTNVGR